MALFAPKSPVAPDEQAWIDESFAWLVEQFGDDVARRPVVEPTRAHFPVAGFRSEAGVRAVLDLVAARMAVPAGLVELDYVAAHPGGRRRSQHAYRGPAGHYHQEGGRAVVTVYGDQMTTPTTLVATLAHELGHVRLLGEGRIADDRRDGEPLTDLLTVVFGYGIFTANAAFEFTADAGGWESQRLGYLTEQMYGYALARFVRLRGEHDPAWAGHLDTNPRHYMRQSLRYLHRGCQSDSRDRTASP